HSASSVHRDYQRDAHTTLRKFTTNVSCLQRAHQGVMPLIMRSVDMHTCDSGCIFRAADRALEQPPYILTADQRYFQGSPGTNLDFLHLSCSSQAAGVVPATQWQSCAVWRKVRCMLSSR
ncbi:MAG TPA: hypothetical protein VHV10_01720, partial [Ktedonobacteraceae bacterium]|nr:hypothetical protein [Ktedonobacteraceae bacterium]